jgi:hypothetical protein
MTGEPITQRQLLDMLAGLPPQDLEEVRQFIDFLRFRHERPAPSLNDRGWPEGFFEKTFGSLPLLTREPQGDYETRDNLA